jgi:hypothetical protein
MMAGVACSSFQAVPIFDDLLRGPLALVDWKSNRVSQYRKTRDKNTQDSRFIDSKTPLEHNRIRGRECMSQRVTIEYTLKTWCSNALNNSIWKSLHLATFKQHSVQQEKAGQIRDNVFHKPCTITTQNNLREWMRPFLAQILFCLRAMTVNVNNTISSNWNTFNRSVIGK